MNEQINVGDRVVLKSGSERMTVNDRRDDFSDGHIELDCVWFNRAGEVQRDTFDLRALRKVDDDVPRPGQTSVTLGSTRR